MRGDYNVGVVQMSLILSSVQLFRPHKCKVLTTSEVDEPCLLLFQDMHPVPRADRWEHPYRHTSAMQERCEQASVIHSCGRPTDTTRDNEVSIEGRGSHT